MPDTIEPGGDHGSVKENELTTHDWATILFNSFRFSQSDPQLQLSILRYARATYPHTQLPEQSALSEMLLGMIKPLTSPDKTPLGGHRHKVMSQDIIQGEIDKYIKRLYEFYDADFDPTYTQWIGGSMVQNIIQADYNQIVMKYLKGGRFRSAPSGVRGNDPWQSHMRDFVGDQANLGHPFFKQMFANLHVRALDMFANNDLAMTYVDRATFIPFVQRAEEQKGYRPPTAQIQLGSIASVWEEYHPGQGSFYTPFLQGTHLPTELLSE